MTKLALFARLTALMPVLFLLLLGADAPTKPAGDLEKLQGKWAIVSAARRGRAMPEEERKLATLEFANDVMSIKVAKPKPVVENGKITLDQTASPKTFDLIPIVEGAAPVANEKPALFIYELNGDDLKICWSKPGDPRPKQFDDPTAFSLMTLKRQPATTQPAGK